MELKAKKPEEFVAILSSLLQTITKADLLKNGKFDEKKCQTSFFSLELGIKMASLLSKGEENGKMLDAFIVIACNLLNCLESVREPLANHHVLRMVFRCTETVSSIAEFFRKRKQALDLTPIKLQLVYLLSKVVFKGLGKHDDFEGFMACGINNDMGDIDTSVRDMALSLWLVLDEQTKSFL